MELPRKHRSRTILVISAAFAAIVTHMERSERSDFRDWLSCPYGGTVGSFGKGETMDTVTFWVYSHRQPDTKYTLEDTVEEDE